MFRIISFLLVSAGLASSTVLPLVFEANEGQADPEARYVAHMPKGTVWLDGRQAVLGSASGVLRIGFDGGSLKPEIKAEDALPGKVNYLTGNDPSKWHMHVPLFGKVRYIGVWPGIDVVFYGNPDDLEFDLAVAPGADPDKIRLHYEGATKIALDPAGGLIITVGRDQIRQHAPHIYQGEKTVRGRYVLLGGNYVRFQLAAFDKSKRMVIDPVMTYATYWGGSGYQQASAAALDADGNVVIAGYTTSLGYNTVNAYSSSNASGQSAFIAKFNPSGATPGASIIFSTYFGGILGPSIATAVALDPSGNIYFTGVTNATDLPLSNNAYQRTPLTTLCQIETVNKTQVTVCGTGFVSKFAPAGDQLLYSTYLGGEDLDYPLAIAVDAQGNMYVAGQTYSESFPLSNAYQTHLAGSDNAFLSKLSSDGSTLLYSTFFGGASSDWINGIALDPSGRTYVGGVTYSQQLPVTPGAYSASLQGPNSDGFLAQFDLTKFGPASLLYSSYIGGKGGDSQVNGVAADAAGNIYATGFTASPNFPVTSGAVQTTFGSAAADAKASNSSTDAFVVKLNPTAQGSEQLVYSSYFGGEFNDVGNAIALDSAGKILIAGSTNSDNFPETPDAFDCCYAIQVPVNGTVPNTGFWGRVDLTQSGPAGLLYSTLIGGNTGNDAMYAVAVNANASLVAVAGSVSSTDVPITAAAYQNKQGGSQAAAYVAVFNLKTAGPTIGNATNAASFAPKNFSPGMIFTIFGNGLGPDQGLGPELDAKGRVSTSLGGTQVLIGGYAAPILYTSATQVNAVVPYELDPTKLTGGVFLQAIYNGVAGAVRQVAIVPTAPGIFVISPQGQGAIVNQDGSINGPGNPAAKNSYIQIYATGEGQTNPPGIDGQVTVGSVSSLPRPVATVSVSIGGVTVPSSSIAYAGAAPAEVAGLFQITLQIPSNIPSGLNPVVITIGTGNNAVMSQAGVTIVVQ